MNSGPDERPTIRIGYISGDGVVETTGQYAFGYFETLPAVGDVLVLRSTFEDAPDPMVVSGRYFVQDVDAEACWWIITRPAEAADGWQAVLDIERDTNQAFAEIRAEDYADFVQQTHRQAVEKKRLKQEAKAAGKVKK